jgi:hypothetical protein
MAVNSPISFLSYTSSIANLVLNTGILMVNSLVRLKIICCHYFNGAEGSSISLLKRLENEKLNLQHSYNGNKRKTFCRNLMTSRSFAWLASLLMCTFHSKHPREFYTKLFSDLYIYSRPAVKYLTIFQIVDGTLTSPRRYGLWHIFQHGSPIWLNTEQFAWLMLMIILIMIVSRR